MSDDPVLHLAVDVLSEVGEESRNTLSILWRIVEFFATLITTLLAVGFAVLGLSSDLLPAEGRYLVVFFFGLLATFFGYVGIETWTNESFYWERDRFIHRKLRKWVMAASSDGSHPPLDVSWTTLAEANALGIDHSQTKMTELFATFLGNTLDAGFRHEIMREIHSRIVPYSGVRRAMLITLTVLAVGSAVLCALASALALLSSGALVGLVSPIPMFLTIGVGVGVAAGLLILLRHSMCRVGKIKRSIAPFVAS